MRITGPSEGPSPFFALTQSSREIGKTFIKLASGNRLASSAEDPSGAGRSARRGATIRSLESTERGIQDGISLARSAEGQLGEVGNLLSRMRELALQSSNGTLSQGDRDTIQAEFDSLRSEVDRFSEESEFNGQQLLDGSNSSVEVRVDPESDESIEIALRGASSRDLNIETSDVSSSEDASASLEELDAAIDSVSSYRGDLGATENGLASSLRSAGIQKLNLAESNSRISDADLAVETAVLAQQQLLQKGTASVLLQSNVAASRAQSLLGGYA